LYLIQSNYVQPVKWKYKSFFSIPIFSLNSRLKKCRSSEVLGGTLTQWSLAGREAHASDRGKKKRYDFSFPTKVNKPRENTDEENQK